MKNVYIFVIFLITMSCEDSLNEKIIGEWRVDRYGIPEEEITDDIRKSKNKIKENTVIWEFDDGKFILTGVDNTTISKYRIWEDSLEIEDLPYIKKFEIFKIDDNRMILKSSLEENGKIVDLSIDLSKR